jgi:hypothetical protein
VKVIGLTGYAGSGKSTVANYLVEEHGFTRLSFAAPLKKMLRTLDPALSGTPGAYQKPFRVTEALEHYGSENALKESVDGPEYRRLLQVLGTDCIRAVDEEFWVRAGLAQMADPDGKYVFDDARFPNEAEVISEFNPFGLWNVTRPGYEAVNGHDSEKWAGNMGERIWLHNGAGLEVLHDQIDHALNAVAA